MRGWFCVLALLIASAFSARAAVVYVNKNVGGTIHDGQTWATAFVSVQQGIDAAAPSASQVWVAAAVYAERITLKKGVALYGGFAGGETALAQRNPALRPTVLDGGGAGAVVKVETLATTATRLDGFTVRNGNAIMGGGVVCALASPTIANCTITGNTSIGYGGGISADRGSSPVIVNNVISGNTATSLDGDGGGIACLNEGGGGSNAVIVGNLIRANTAVQTGGGIAIYGSSPTIANNVIVDNQSYVVAEESTGEGKAPRTSWGGGGIYVTERNVDEKAVEGVRANPTIVNNVISGNGGPFFSGGIYVRKAEFSAPLIANNTIISNNGAGLAFADAGPAVVNNIISGNQIGVAGGTNPLGTTTASLRSNCVWGNGRPLIAPQDYLDWPDQTGINGNISADPLLAAPGFGDWHIQPGSPCRDAGDPTVVQPDWTDADGQARLIGRVDIGADETDGAARTYAPLIIRVDPIGGSDANDGSTWAKARKTLQSAISTCALVGGEVWAKAGTYSENLWLRPYVYLYGGFAGTETSRSQRNWSANLTAVDGGARASVVMAVNGYLVSGIDGFTLKNGRGASNGGGVWCNVGSPIVNNTVIRDCTSASNGAGMYVWHASPYITGCTFQNNVPAFGGFGGGIYADWSSALVMNSEFAGNGNDGWGGGMEFHYSSPIIAYNRVHGNKGIGIHCASSIVVVANNAVYENVTSGPGAGMNMMFCTGRVTNNMVVSNRTENVGAGLFVAGSDVSGVVLTVANNTFAGNQANYLGLERGGGIGYYLLTAGNLKIGNNIFAYNTSGIYQQYQSPPGPAANLARNAYYQNIAPDLYGNYVDNPVIGLSLGATDMPNTDPQFVSLNPADLHLRSTSPLINAGDDSWTALADRDWEGRPRILGAHVDVGASEYGTILKPTLNDVRKALRAAAGLSTVTLPEASLLNVVNDGLSFGKVDLRDAIGLAREALM